MNVAAARARYKCLGRAKLPFRDHQHVHRVIEIDVHLHFPAWRGNEGAGGEMMVVVNRELRQRGARMISTRTDDLTQKEPSVGANDSDLK